MLEKALGLRKQTASTSTEAQKKTDERARALIEATRVKATETQLAKEESFLPKKNLPIRSRNKRNQVDSSSVGGPTW